jgi:methionyl aminopeptidase
MVDLKTNEEIEIMKQCGDKLNHTVQDLLPFIQDGITTLEIDQEAERLLHTYGASSSFKRVQGYHWSTCLPINDQVVHTPPSKRKVKNGDVLTLDIGAFYKGFHTDYATTFVIGGKTDEKTQKFLDVGEKTLELALQKVQNGHYLGEISEVIQKEIYGNGYFILKELTGHGVGRELHEDPYVLGYVDRATNKTYKMRPGLVIAVEIIYAMGTEEIRHEGIDDWSIISADHSLTACFEKSIAVTDKNTCILT